MADPGGASVPEGVGLRYLLSLAKNTRSERVRRVAADLIDERLGLAGVERILDRRCTDAVLERWRWSSGYHRGLTEAWQVAADALRVQREDASGERERTQEVCPTRDGRCPCVASEIPLSGVRCLVCATTQHTTEAHARRLPYDEARALLDQTPCVAHFACIGKITCQKPEVDRD